VNAPLTYVERVAEGLALEAAAFAAQGAVTCLWSPRRRALVCPASLRLKPGFETAKRNSATRGWPLHLRPTGGGAVPQGPGVLNLALAFTADRTFSIEDGYRLITRIIQNAIPAGWATGATPNSFCDGAWNLSLNGRKVVGTAQRIRPVGNRQRRILAHALILVEGDLAAGAAAVDAFHRDLSLGPIDENVHTTLDRAIPSQRDPTNTLAASLNEIAQRDIGRATQHLGRRAA
jgi:lipoate-protein ligase A